MEIIIEVTPDHECSIDFDTAESAEIRKCSKSAGLTIDEWVRDRIRAAIEAEHRHVAE